MDGRASRSSVVEVERKNSCKENLRWRGKRGESGRNSESGFDKGFGNFLPNAPRRRLRAFAHLLTCKGFIGGPKHSEFEPTERNLE